MKTITLQFYFVIACLMIAVTGFSQEIDIRGNNVSIVDGDTTPSVSDWTDFGSVQASSGTITKTFTIKNTASSGTLTLGAISISGPNASDFAVAVLPNPTVAPVSNTTFTITFDPSSVGTKLAYFSIINNDSNENPYNFYIKGKGTEPEIQVKGSSSLVINNGAMSPNLPDGTDFGAVNTTSGTSIRNFKIINLSTASQALAITYVTVTGPDAADFIITSMPTPTVAINGTTALKMKFDPSTPGLKTAIVTIGNNDVNQNPYIFAIQGAGTTPEIDIQGNGNTIPDGQLTTSTTDLTHFGTTNIATPVLQVYTIYNSGNQKLNIGSFTFSGPNSSEFVLFSSPGASVPAGESRNFTLRFLPVNPGLRTAMVSIVNTDTDENPYNFNLTGNAVAPEIDITGNGISIIDGATTVSVANNTDFGSTDVVGGTVTHSFVIDNQGTAQLNIGAITFTGANSGDFTIATPPPTFLAPGTTAVFTVVFNPNGVGNRVARINIANNDSNEKPYDFALKGRGLDPEINVQGNNINIADGDTTPAISDGTDFGTAAVNSGTIVKTFKIQNLNTATTNLNLGALSITGANASDFTISVQPAVNSFAINTSTTFQVTFAPTAAGIRNATINIPNNDSNENPYDFAIKGNGAGANMIVIGNALTIADDDTTPSTSDFTDFGTTSPNVAVTTMFSIKNIGTQTLTLQGTPIIAITGADSSSFSVTALPSTSIAVNGTTTFQITFNPTSAGVKTADVVIANNDMATGKNPYNFTITGNAIQSAFDTDGDGIADDVDLDDDNDGIPDTIENAALLADADHDGVANALDLDSDNDGIADIVEAGFGGLSHGTDKMDLTSGWIDANHNGWHDTAEAYYSNSANIDTDNDGAPNYLDLDSDNDSQFDVDEAGIYNGDGDVNGDGVGDGVDSDGDGILDVFDNAIGFGNSGKTLPVNTLGSGNPDYMKIMSQTAGVNDISNTIYAYLDANQDGTIDGAADVDKDGILDAFDTDLTFFGSPRNLDDKLYLVLDGRNDYAQSPQILGGLTKSTLMAWIKLDQNYNANGFVMGQDNFNIQVNVSGSNKQLVATANGISATFSTSLSVNRWYHVAAAYDGANGTLKLYVNGKPEANIANGALSGSLTASTALFSMGKNATTASNYFKGGLDEVRVFNSDLTDDIIQKMVYQEIKQNGTAIRGESIPKDIEASSWASLLAYYRMDVFKNDLSDNLTTASVSDLTMITAAKIFNVKNIDKQLAPMPFTTSQPGAFDLAISHNNFVHAADVTTYGWSIVRVKNNVNLNVNQTVLGMTIDPGVTLNLTNDNKLENTWYLKLDGKLDLQGKSQLIQTASSDLDATSAGFIERDQQGQSNIYNYNYWCSPVGAMNATSNNNNYTVSGVLRDGTNPANPQPINWGIGLNGAPTSPITISGYWIFKFQNMTPVYANWSSVGINGTLLAGQGFTLKGSGAATPTQNLTFVGKPNNGTITATVAGSNLNLSGNPYPSALDADAFITANLASTNGTLYFWEHFSTNTSHNLLDYQGGYATRNLTGGTPAVAPAGISGLGSDTRVPGRFIPVGQGFFVNANGFGGTITFNNNQRAFVKEDNPTSNVMFRQAPVSQRSGNEGSGLNNNDDVYANDGYIRIRLGFDAASHFHRQALLGFMNEHAHALMDAGYDALNIDTQPDDMYLMNAANKLVIEGEGFFNINNTYPIGVKTGSQGIVKFMTDATEHLPEDQGLWIYDNVTHLYHDIKNSTFEIDLPQGTVLDRFSLKFKTEGLLADETFVTNDAALAIVYSNANNTITISNDKPETTVKSVALFNVLGQMVSTWEVSKENQTKIALPVYHQSAGTYIVKVMTSSGNLSKMIIIQ